MRILNFFLLFEMTLAVYFKYLPCTGKEAQAEYEEALGAPQDGKEEEDLDF